jgi:amino acid adenylation domain-containing protein/thioester reductase-like protein
MVYIGVEHEATAPESPWSHSGDSYVVAVNDEGQHAIWPAGLRLPAGWRQKSQEMSRRACRATIDAAWPDIAPASLPGIATPHPAARYVPHLFDEQADTRPGSLAVDAGAAKLTYRQLACSANQLAHHLREIGVGPEVLVGVSMERGAEAVRCLLAIMKAGGAYLPLDPALPPGRLSEMCAEAGPAVIIAGRTRGGDDRGADARAEAFAGTGAVLVPAAELAAASARHPVTAPAAGLGPDNVAYAIYTSGSTGRPKGVAVSHGSLARQLLEVARVYQISPQDRVLALASLAFDTSVEQMLVTLISGATLLLPPPGTIAPTDLLSYLAEQRATVADLTPAYWHQLLAITARDSGNLTGLRLMITGGEMASAQDCQAALRAARGARLINAYGLTETTITSVLYDVSPQAADAEPVSPVPVGQPLPHAEVLVLGEDLEPVPDGTVGEIYLGGQGVARGYLGQPGRTAERFVPDPHSQVPGGRMYRTGDLGQWLDGRDLVVIGRADRQLKVRGFRIEPAEIEHALATHPAIRQAAVVAHEVGPDNTQLVAYYVRRAADGKQGAADGKLASPGGAHSHQQLSGECLRAFLADRLPRFMIPAEFVALHQIPRTPDGEINRQALTYQVAGGGEGKGGGERYTPTQAGLSHLWSRLLRTEQVRLDDDFFTLGGNSLLAAEMLAHARVMFGIGPGYVRPLTRCLLRDATLRGFSDATQAARAGKLNAASSDAHIDFAHDAELGHPLHPVDGPLPDWQQPQQVFLTGATGFLGAHLLRELLTSTAADVHCLVRARDEEHALRRITEAASRYAVEGLELSRVVPVVGDLAEPRFGLPACQFGQLARHTDVIYHAGALVNFIYPYAELRSANVGGTREVIRLASMCRGIPVHYVSTTAVLAGFGAMGVREVTEGTPLAYAGQLGIGYVETKFVAEELLRNAGREGLPVAIYRPLDIVGDLRSGTWNTATEMCALIRFMTDTGLAPDIDLPLDFVPADICAAAIGYISTRIGAIGVTYHLSSPAYGLLASLVDRLVQHRYQVKAIPYDEWVGELVKHAADNPGHPMTPFVPLFVDHCAGSELTVAEMYLEHVFPTYTRKHLERALTGSGIAFPPVDAALFDLAIGRLMADGFLRTPDAGQLFS